MKNYIKQIWSEWNYQDKVITIISIVGIIILCLIMCTSCQIRSELHPVSTMEYGDAETEVVEDNYIPLYADGVVDFIYCTQDNEFIIEYMDDDYFDIDNLPQTVNCASADSVVSIYCSEKDFREYLDYYNSCTTYHDFYAADSKFYISEAYVDAGENSYWYYRLVRK